MSRLIVNPGTPKAWEINLKPGANFLGRSDANDFKINDPSVSGSHCQVHVNENGVFLKDSGSTNGTYVGGARIQEKQLEHGQALKLGSAELIFYSDTIPSVAPAAVRVAAPVAVSSAAPPPPAVPAVGSLRVAKLAEPKTVAVAAPVAAAPMAEGAPEVAPEMLIGQKYCKYHPSSPGHHFCARCKLIFCDLCIDMSEVTRSCRKCGSEVIPFQFKLPPARSFYSKLPGAFGFPFKGAGIVILVCATIAFAALSFVGGGIFGIFIKIALLGFVFLFMQNIILTTTSDEKDGLGFPDPSGLYGAAFQLVGTAVASFWLLIGLMIARYEDVEIPSEAIIAAVILGGVYFPMALLAVAMKDSVLAANPLVVIPAMVKVPGKYSVTALLTLAVFGIRQLGSMVSGMAGSTALRTKSVNEFMVAAAIQMVWALISVYLLVVTMRILGLFYNSSKQKLGWYTH